MCTISMTSWREQTLRFTIRFPVRLAVGCQRLSATWCNVCQWKHSGEATACDEWTAVKQRPISSQSGYRQHLPTYPPTWPPTYTTTSDDKTTYDDTRRAINVGCFLSRRQMAWKMSGIKLSAIRCALEGDWASHDVENAFVNVFETEAETHSVLSPHADEADVTTASCR